MFPGSNGKCMKKRVLAKNLRRTIRDSFGRYLAIVVIIALGAGMFVGLLSTKGDMVATGQKYMDEQYMFDLRLLSTYGWTQTEVDAVAQMDGVEYAEGSVSLDVIGRQWNGAKDAVYKFHTIPQQVSQVYLLGGRMPQSPDECLIDGHNVGDEVLGLEFVVSRENSAETLDAMEYDSYTIVGYVSSPLYMDMSRGSTSIGNGNVAGYVYIPADAVRLDYYTEIAVTLEGNHEIYSDAYTRFLEDMGQALKPGVTVLAGNRFQTLKSDAQTEYEKGYQSYEDGLAEYEAGRQEAMDALADALSKLLQGQKEIDDNRAVILEALAELDTAQKELDDQRVTLEAGKIELAAQKAQAYQTMAQAHSTLTENRKSAADGLKQVQEGIVQIEAGLLQLDDGILQLQDGLAQVESGLKQLQAMVALKETQVAMLRSMLDAANGADTPNKELIKRLDDAYQQANQEFLEYHTQYRQVEAMASELTAQLEQLQAQHQLLTAQRQELLDTEETLKEALDAIDAGFLELESSRLLAEAQFAEAEAQFASGQQLLDEGQAALDAGRLELEEGQAELQNAQAELDAAMTEYEAGKTQTEAELADAKRQLDDAAAQLADARDAIDAMAPAEVFLLDRNANVGYLALDNNSDIVAGVSRVFPAFFLLVAALVCITTMTRMVEEERTQIGTFKALGYKNSAIIRKYMMYAGSAAILGCGLGVLLGSVVFPVILWDVYGLLLNITPRVVLKINWPLCAAVVSAYSVVMLLVTWYCCRRALKEVPAELIRPKSPTSGKKIWMEYLPFWKHISFLNKVMLRNVFRYRQRMLMMLVGIGGCTALLLTGYGLRDSIVNIVSDQFENVTTYDLQIYFSDGQTPEKQQQFRDAVKKHADCIHFFYQTGVDMEYASATSEIYMIATDQNMDGFIHFRDGGQELPFPGVNEALLTVGVAEKMGVSVGDTVLLRDSDMRELEVRISGIYENQVYNYIIVTPQTLQTQWGSTPENQMAVVNVRDYADVHQVSAYIGRMDSVLNVMVTEDTANQVSSMLKALDTIVVVIVICAGALAFTVLYNLTNINITERIREIATIKVLGFRSGESAAYVFKENLLLTAMGMVFGLFLGKWLLDFVISQIKIDMIWLTTSIQPMSCVYAVLLTMLSAVIVDFVLYFKLEKINMAEALKSVE